MPNSQLYIDHNATSPFTLEHWKQVQETLFSKPVGNPSSPHQAGRTAQNLLSTARRSVAASLNCDPAELVFLASATEANNIVISGTHWAEAVFDELGHPSIVQPMTQSFSGEKGRSVRFVTEEIETGSSTDYTADAWMKRIFESLTLETEFLCVSAANNEVGIQFPVGELGHLLQILRYPESHFSKSQIELKEKYAELLSTYEDQPTEKGDASFFQKLHLHVDATQALGKLRPELWTSPGIDTLAVSGHKIGALPGGAALVIRRGRKLKPLFLGGAQERSRRAGTENLPAIVSFGIKTAELQSEEHWSKVETLRSQLIPFEKNLGKLSGLRLLSNLETGLPNTVHFLLDSKKGFFAEDMLIELDMKGIAASSGSACSSGTNRPSSVVKQMGFSDKEAANAIRLSFGTKVSDGDLETVLETITRFFESQR